MPTGPGVPTEGRSGGNPGCGGNSGPPVPARALLFDLDGTLLELDMDEFLPRYLRALAPFMAPVVAPMPPEEFVRHLLAATEAMLARRGGASGPAASRTNREVFEEVFFARVPVDREAFTAAADRFYAEVFPTLAPPAADPGRRAAARAVVAEAVARGWRIALATQPVYPEVAIRERMRWAGVHDFPWDLVTSYEHMHATKPDPAFFREVCHRLGCPPERCWMVGDDPQRDLPARAIGLRAYWVVPDGTRPPEAPEAADAWGTLRDLRELLSADAL